MILNFINLLQNNAWADMATGKMAGAPSAMHANAVQVNAAIQVSSRNLNIVWFSYGFAAALVLISIYFLIRVRRQTDVTGKKRSLIVGAALFGMALLLWILPARFFPTPIAPENFDMRAT